MYLKKTLYIVLVMPKDWRQAHAVEHVLNMFQSKNIKSQKLNTTKY